MIRVGDAATAPDFPDAARSALGNAQLRRNVRHATDVIRGKRALSSARSTDWQALREAGRRSRRTSSNISTPTCRSSRRTAPRRRPRALGRRCGRSQPHHRRHHQVARRVRGHQGQDDDVGRDAAEPALEAAGIAPYETDLADLIIQLGDDRPSHIVVPALHRNRAEIREIFLRRMGLTELGGEPEDLTAAARRFLREKFLRVPIGFSGANFLVAGTGGVCVVESEGNARMCLTLPRVLITLAGIEKVVPTLQDLEVFLQLLPRSATGERMNPYNTIWTGVTAGDGPRGVPRRAARQRPHESARRRRRRARRCTASAAPPA